MSPNDHNWVRGWFISDPLCLVFLVIMGLYFVCLEGWLGATLGKWVLGLRVIAIDGSRAGLWKSIVRNALRLVDGLPAFNLLGVILIQRSRKRARFGDRIAGTRVIRVSKSSQATHHPRQGVKRHAVRQSPGDRAEPAIADSIKSNCRRKESIDAPPETYGQ
jgi:uncharacterized RDD family membrane protein YckC